MTICGARKSTIKSRMMCSFPFAWKSLKSCVHSWQIHGINLPDAASMWLRSALKQTLSPAEHICGFSLGKLTFSAFAFPPLNCVSRVSSNSASWCPALCLLFHSKTLPWRHCFISLQQKINVLVSVICHRGPHNRNNSDLFDSNYGKPN